MSQKVLVAGTGISGIAAAKLLLSKGGEVVLYDGNEKLDPEELKKKFAKNSWDIEMKKVVNKILEGRETVIEEIEDCKTPQELESFLTPHDKSFAETYWRALAEKRKSFTLKQNKSKSHLICHGRKSV